MRVPLDWLSEYCDPGWEAAELAEKLSMAGTEVERVEGVGAPVGEGFVVGEVTSVEPHPDADRLQVCKVDVGGERTIVCGAPNVASGQRVAVALPGAVLPDGTKLKKAKLRGVTSEGMILSESELGIGEGTEGILVLEQAAEPGAPLAEVLSGSSAALDLEVTTNRPDCLSIYGVAREVHAVSGSPLAAPPWSDDATEGGNEDVSQLASVEVECPEMCPRFTARVFTEVEVGDSPDWLVDSLVAAGQRSINNVVDITNYVMLATGQPLHAFDLDRLDGAALTVRLARDGEQVETLDGETRPVPSGAIVITDGGGLVSVAGIMGGASSEVDGGTTRVLLESATWNGPAILRTSRDLSLRSEASARFEKGLHPELAMRAQRMASRLLVEICGAAMAPGTIDTDPDPVSPLSVSMSVDRLAGLVGMEIPPEVCVERLTRLGFEVEASDDTLVCAVPPERGGDVTREVDLIEEVARLGDLDAVLPSTLPAVGDGRSGGLSEDQSLVRRAEDLLRDLGGHEVITYSFQRPDVAGLLRLEEGDPLADPVRISNPIAEDQAAMRTSLLHGLLTSAASNLAHGAGRVFLFESGRVYLPGPANVEVGEGPLVGRFLGERESPVVEPHHIAGIFSGSEEPGWRDAKPAPDFFSAKAVVEALGNALGNPLEFAEYETRFLRPGRTARILTSTGEAGWIGEIDPRVSATWDLPLETVAFELSLGALADGSEVGRETFADFSVQPPVYEDLAIVVGEEVGADSISSTIREAGGDLVEAVDLFDLYRSEELGEGRKSLALRVTFRAAGRTLTDQEVSASREQILSAIERIGGRVRD